MVSDKNLIEKTIKNSDDKSFEILKNRHAGLFYEVCKRYLSRLNSKNIDSQDIIEDYNYILYKAAKSYNITKNTKFSTWLAINIRFHCLNLINSIGSHIHLPIHDIKDTNNEKNLTYSEKNLDNHRYFEYILRQLKDSRIEKVYKLRYYNGINGKKAPWRVVAKEMNISIQAAINLHNKATKFLKRKYLSEYDIL